MKQDNFKQFIEEHRSDFDTEMPSEQLWDKLNSRLEEQQEKKKTRSILWYSMRVAAVFAIVAATYVFVSMYTGKQEHVSVKDKIDITDEQVAELMEAEAFYTAQVNERRQEVFQLISHQPDVKQDITNDLTELDSAYADLKTELKDNVANEQIIDAMIQNYRIRLEILENLLQRIKQTQVGNNSRKEKTYEL